jgi:hypothetical protein
MDRNRSPHEDHSFLHARRRTMHDLLPDLTGVLKTIRWYVLRSSATANDIVVPYIVGVLLMFHAYHMESYYCCVLCALITVLLK